MKTLKVKDLVSNLEKQGWYIDRTKGSHRQLKHEHQPGTVTVAGNPTAHIRRKTLIRIYQQAGIYYASN